jgi:cell wall-associated NlpC family hydrolase
MCARMTEGAWTNEYVGIPFLVRGRTHEGCDCWGLVRLVEAERFECFLPSLCDEYVSLEREQSASIVHEHLNELPLDRVTLPIPGDMVLLNLFGSPCHVGVYIGDGLVLHSDPMGQDTSRIDRITSAHIAPRIEGFYRVRANASG